MDLPLAMERPNTEAVTPYSIAISFFAPRPTLPKMKIQRFVLQVGRAARFGSNYGGFVCRTIPTSNEPFGIWQRTGGYLKLAYFCRKFSPSQTYFRLHETRMTRKYLTALVRSKITQNDEHFLCPFLHHSFRAFELSEGD